MNKTSLVIVLGVMAVMIFGIVFFVSSMDYSGETVTLMDDEVIAANLETGEMEVETLETNGFTYENSDFLLTLMSESEYNDFLGKLEEVYMVDFTTFLNLDVKTDAYYSENSQSIKETTGLDSYDQFERLYNKLVVIPDYDTCHIEFLTETMMDDGDRLYVDVLATYDQVSEVEFYIIIDKKTLNYRIF